MNNTGRIGLIVPEINSTLDHDFLDGAFEQAKHLGYDVIVYTGIFNSLRELRFDSYIAGLENIYTLICTHHLDGIIYAAERFHADDVIKKIFDYLSQTDTPCLVLGKEHEKFSFMDAEEFYGIYSITKHLIDEHQCKKLYCITGVPNHKSSLERLRGFQKACADSGIKINQSDVFYGYFWKDVPFQIGRDIADGKIKRPDAIVCASDVMAFSLIQALTEHGIRVPEDIAVTGFDGGLDAVVCKPPITTVQGRDRQFGADSVCHMHEMIAGVKCENICMRQNIRFGQSCGCCAEEVFRKNTRLDLESSIHNMLQRNIEKHTFIATDFINHIAEASDLTELSVRIDEVGHIFNGADWIDISLCEDWQADLNFPDNFRQYGYSEKMYLLLSKRFGKNEKEKYLYPTADILPALSKPHEPHIVVITSLHCNGQIFGYTAMAYKDSNYIDIDELYVSWCDAISNGLKSLQKRMRIQNFNQQLEKLEADPLTGMLNRKGFLMHIPEVTERYMQEEKRCILVLITYFPDKMNMIDPSAAIADIILNHCRRQLCARIQEGVFAALIPLETDENEAAAVVDFTAFIETSLRTRFNTDKIPEFIAEISEITSENIKNADDLLNDMLIKLFDKKKTAQNNLFDYKEQIYRLRRCIVSDPQLEWNIQETADKMCISRSHLQRLYKQFFSVSLKDDIISARIRRAMQLLTHTDMRIQEVAERCGYNNENHFMRQFRDKTGMTASDYRRNNK